MRRRIAPILLVATAPLWMASCMTTLHGGQFPTTDWTAIEQNEMNTRPLSVAPEIEMFKLRIPLFKTQLTGQDTKGPDAPRGGTEADVALGVSCGNGLALGIDGNVFIDVVQLLDAGSRNSFSIKVGNYTLVKTGSAMEYRAPLAGPVKVSASDTGMTVGGALAKSGYTIDNGDYKYSSGVMLAPTYDFRVTDNGVEVVENSLLSRTIPATLSGSTVDFGILFSVTKSGDKYTIREIPSPGKTYSLYYLDHRILFCDGDFVVKDIRINDGQILVNGSKAADFNLE